MKTVFGKVIFMVILAFSLVAASCNTNQRGQDMRETEEGTEDVRMRDRQESDTVSMDRETIREDDEGYGDTKTGDDSDVDLERDME